LQTVAALRRPQDGGGESTAFLYIFVLQLQSFIVKGQIALRDPARELVCELLASWIA